MTGEIPFVPGCQAAPAAPSREVTEEDRMMARRVAADARQRLRLVLERLRADRLGAQS
ncbi:hypothetical protein ACWENQ_40175 [Nonomuraea sp. NPDC004354]|uniref:hypothetical protein n=1 Tax=Nonomuraea sp. NPDC003804 TaxID=3154547 RepID=UPI0033B2C3B9